MLRLRAPRTGLVAAAVATSGTGDPAGLGADLAEALRAARPPLRVILLWATAGLALAALSSLAAAKDSFAGDLWLTRRIQAIDAGVLTGAMRAATDLSGPGGSVAAFIGVVLGFLLLRRFRLALFAAAAAWTHLLGGTLKLLVDRPRPSGEVIDTVRLETEFSFPSGHIEWVVGFEGFLVFAIWRLTPNRLVRYVTLAAWFLHMGLTGLGRVDQGLHWPSDVLGGFLVGLLALSVTVWAYAASRRIPLGKDTATSH